MDEPLFMVILVDLKDKAYYSLDRDRGVMQILMEVYDIRVNTCLLPHYSHDVAK